MAQHRTLSPRTSRSPGRAGQGATARGLDEGSGQLGRALLGATCERPINPGGLLTIQRAAGNRAATRLVSNARQRPAPTSALPRVQRLGGPDKAQAQESLLAWNTAAHTTIDANRAWVSGNWTEYYGHTQQNPRLAWSKDVLSGTISNALGNLITELGAGTIRRAAKQAAGGIGALIGTAVLPGAGTVIGFLIGVLVEQAASMIYDAIFGDPAGKAAYQAGQRTARLIAIKDKQLNAAARKSRAQHQAAFKRFQLRLNKFDTQTEVDNLKNWADREEAKAKKSKPPESDRSLFEQMLKDWVREHAGDEEDANKATAEHDWEQARKRAFGKGDSLDRHPEIFAYQTRAHWADVGIAGSALGYANQIVERANRLKTDSDAEKKFDGLKIKFSSSAARPNPRLVQFLLNRHKGSARGTARMRRRRHEEFKAGKRAYGARWYYDEQTQLEKGNYTFNVTLDLDTADGACYVNEWEYDYTVRDVQGYQWRGDHYEKTRTMDFSGSWDVSPD